MRKSYTYRSQALRFRRWSRKAYAAFISVQRAVTIGQLSFSVADRFEKKNQSLHTGIGTFTDGFFEEDDEEPRGIAWTVYGITPGIGIK